MTKNLVIMFLAIEISPTKKLERAESTLANLKSSRKKDECEKQDDDPVPQKRTPTRQWSRIQKQRCSPTTSSSVRRNILPKKCLEKTVLQLKHGITKSATVYDNAFDIFCAEIIEERIVGNKEILLEFACHEVEDLACNHEEADTRMLAHAKSCHTTSAFFGKGKSSALKIAMESEEYAPAFSNLGNELDVPSSTKAVLKKFVCHLYGAENQCDVNLVR
ncbi:Hypothetical predicted protein [Paramuricea clavata]|uniref:Uncharacterized protein n=1 Tax=Paramuricea clavata TaxID=317549 RepID=A0A6S7JCI7_PARCT|nr:Hypothetical predicted protein [Paramuricea clavata]